MRIGEVEGSLDLRKGEKAMAEISVPNLWNVANKVTAIRTGLLFLLVALVYVDHAYLNMFNVLLCALIFGLDRLDGYLAKKFECRTEFGGVLDVVGDRMVENVLWICLADLDLIPIWIPIVVLSRGFITDGFRSYALSKGKTTFAMMNSKAGEFLVASPASRLLYGLSKAILFTLALAIYALKPLESVQLEKTLEGLTLFVVAFCLVRGFLAVRDCFSLFRPTVGTA